MKLTICKLWPLHYAVMIGVKKWRPCYRTLNECLAKATRNVEVIIIDKPTEGGTDGPTELSQG